MIIVQIDYFTIEIQMQSYIVGQSQVFIVVNATIGCPHVMNWMIVGWKNHLLVIKFDGVPQWIII
jgi:hypothetical protein